MIIKQATSASTPAVGPISSFTSSPSERPSRRVDEQHHKVLHRAGQHHPGEDPDHPRQIAHLRRQHRPHQRPRAGNRRKMVTEQHFFIGRDIIEAVVMPHGGRHARRVNRQHVFGDIEAVKTIGDQINADCRDDNPAH
jgi:hypothetical protein